MVNACEFIRPFFALCFDWDLGANVTLAEKNVMNVLVSYLHPSFPTNKLNSF